MTHNTRILTLGLAVLLTASGGAARAGDLNPPPGPVAPTMKPLSDLEPRIAINSTNTPGDADSLFKITQPGSYYLTGNITGVAGRHGVEIAASGVTLDLHGFDLQGVAGSLDGVSVTVGSLAHIAVANGSVRSWSGDGVDLGSTATNCGVAEVRAGGNTGNGIKAGIGCTVSNCLAFQNGGYGVGTGSGSTVSNCTAYQNTSHGINTGLGGTISSCSAYANSGSGINTGTGCTVSNCSAYMNTSHGMAVGVGSTVTGCSARLNALDGIACVAACVIRGNTCSQNGNGGDGAGIHVTSAGNRIEGNNCTAADRGIDVDTAGNIIIKNACSGNTTNWDIVANNVYGPIIDRTAPASPAVFGNSAASSLGSTDANANFTY